MRMVNGCAVRLRAVRCRLRYDGDGGTVRCSVVSGALVGESAAVQLSPDGRFLQHDAFFLDLLKVLRHV